MGVSKFHEGYDIKPMPYIASAIQVNLKVSSHACPPECLLSVRCCSLFMLYNPRSNSETILSVPVKTISADLATFNL